MRGLGGPSVQRGIHLQQTDGQASVEELTGGPQHSAVPAQHSCAPSSQSWCCGGIHGNGRFERPSRRSQTHLDPAGTIIRVNVRMNVPFFQQYTYSIMLYSFFWLLTCPALQDREQKICPCFGRKGRPSRERLQRAQQKHSSVACQCCPSYVI